jgi:hypothetical protein
MLHSLTYTMHVQPGTTEEDCSTGQDLSNGKQKPVNKSLLLSLTDMPWIQLLGGWFYAVKQWVTCGRDQCHDNSSYWPYFYPVLLSCASVLFPRIRFLKKMMPPKPLP